MKSQKILQTILLMSCLSISSFAFSLEILCPSAFTMKNAWRHINTIQILVDGFYLAYSDFPCIYDDDTSYLWQIVAKKVTAPDFNTAFTMSQNNIKNVLSLKEKYATDTSYGYVCHYLDSAANITAFAISDKNEPVSIMKNVIKNFKNMESVT